MEMYILNNSCINKSSDATYPVQKERKLLVQSHDEHTYRVEEEGELPAQFPD